jgi:hypothetical protein
MARREYTAGRPTKLDGAFNIGDTTFAILDDTNWPTGADYPFWVTIDAGTAQEERVLCLTQSSKTVTVASGGRGADGTSESNHASGANIWPSWSATDADEANAHVNASTNVHGLATAGPSSSSGGSVVGTSAQQTLTNKTVSLTNNTLTGTRAQFNTAMTDGDFATIAGAETLTSKTLTSPVITGGTLNGGTALTVNSTELNLLDGLTATAAELNGLDALTANRVLISSATGLLIESPVTNTELSQLDGISTVNTVQAQLNGKQATISGGATSITSSNLTASRALISDASGKVAISSVTSTELALLDGLPSNIPWDSDPGTSVSGFVGTDSYARAKRSMGVVTVHLYLIKTGSTITTGAEGNIANTVVYTLDSEFRPTYDFTVMFDINGESGGAAVINSNGAVEIRSFFDEDSEIASGDSIRITATYVL